MSDLDALQQQMAELRRNLILDAATRVFADKGFHRATIKDVAREAGIADGTIYNYFENKDDLLAAILRRLNAAGQGDDLFQHKAGIDLRRFMVAYVRQRISLLWPNYDVFKALLPELMVNADLREMYYQQALLPAMQAAEEFFAAQVDAGKLRRIDVPTTIRAISGMVFGLLVLEMLGDEHLQVAWEDAPETLAAILYDGLKPDKR